MILNGIHVRLCLNFKKHKVSFDRATNIFRDPNAISIADEEHSDTEERWVTIGVDQAGSVLVVVHTFLQLNHELSRIRVISARKATHNEVKQLIGQSL